MIMRRLFLPGLSTGNVSVVLLFRKVFQEQRRKNYKRKIIKTGSFRRFLKAKSFYFSQFNIALKKKRKILLKRRKNRFWHVFCSYPSYNQGVAFLPFDGSLKTDRIVHRNRFRLTILFFRIFKKMKKCHERFHNKSVGYHVQHRRSRNIV